MLFKLLSTKHLDPLYSNVIRFKTEQQRYNFFLKHCNFQLDKWDEYKTLNYAPLNDTSIILTMEIDANDGLYYENDGLVDYFLSKYNYCVGCVFSDTEVYYYKFYFIKNVEILNVNTARVYLELDIFTTYLDVLNNPFENSSVYVKRKHCKRFDSNGNLIWKDAVLGDDLDIKFDAQVIKKVESCEIDYLKSFQPFSKTVYSIRDGTNVNVGLSQTDIDNFNNLLNTCGWLYFFFSDDPSELFSTNVHRCSIGNVNTGLYVFAIPINTNFKIFNPYADDVIDNVIFYDASEKVIGGGVYDIFRNSSSLVAVQFSRISPFMPNRDYSSIDTRMGLENFNYPFLLKYNNEIYLNTFTNSRVTGNYENEIQVSYLDGLKNACISILRMNNELFESLEIVNDIPKNVTISNDNLYKYSYEPKLWCSPYFKMGLKSNESQDVFFNPLILNSNYRVIINRTISPVNEKVYATLVSNTSSIYDNYNKNNVGLFTTNTNELTTSSSAYKDWWARNSSAMVTGLAIPLVNDTFKSAFSGFQGGGAAGAVVGGVTTAINTVNDFVGNQINLKDTPDSIKNKGNNGYFEYSRKNNNQSYQLLITQYELIESEKKQVYDYFYRYGYQVNRLEKWLNLFTRSRFNYIKLADEQLTSKMNINLSNNLKLIISNIFNNGLTIWEYKTWDTYGFNLTNENKEI